MSRLPITMEQTTVAGSPDAETCLVSIYAIFFENMERTWFNKLPLISMLILDNR